MNATTTTENSAYALKNAVQKLLLVANWNCTSRERHIAKVVFHANKGDLVKAIDTDLKTLGAYMDHMADVVDELRNRSDGEIMRAIDKFITESPSLDRAFSVHNYVTLRNAVRLDLITDFSSEFRGLVASLTTINFSKGTKTIIRACGNSIGSDDYYVAASQKGCASMRFGSFDAAVAYCLSPEYHLAIAKLLS